MIQLRLKNDDSKEILSKYFDDELILKDGVEIYDPEIASLFDWEPI